MRQSSATETKVPSILFNIKSVNGASDSLVVEGRLGGRQRSLIIDTGSSISLVRPDMLQEEPEPLQEGWLRTVTGERAPVHGWSNMQLGIGTLEIPHKMLVADIKDECILGFDFLMKHNCLVDLKESMLSIHNQQIPLQCPKETTLNCCKVSLDDSIDLPPMSETVASARILDRPSNSGWGILELENGLSIKPKDGLLVGRMLVNLNAERVSIHLMNLTSQPNKERNRGGNLQCC